jgi:hypothetical protein
VLCNDPACNLYGATAASAGAEVPFLRPGTRNLTLFEDVGAEVMCNDPCASDLTLFADVGAEVMCNGPACNL